MKNTFNLLILLFAMCPLKAQNALLPLWENGQIPNYQKSDEKETRDTTDIVRISYVQNPDIAVFLPSAKNATGQAVVICPGGGYWILAYDWEGTDIAKWLNANGIAAIVLKYRLPVAKSNVVPHKSPLLDAQRAMRLVRYHAGEWNIDPEKIGIMGFSAGGHLASTLSTHFDRGIPESKDPVDQMSCRPDFSILIYPVISFTGDYVHTGSRIALIGENPEPELIINYSNELQIKEDTPPAFLIHSGDDTTVPVENSISYFSALRARKIPAEMHIYPYGGHGFSLAIGKGYLATWTARCIDWINSLNSK